MELNVNSREERAFGVEALEKADSFGLALLVFSVRLELSTFCGHCNEESEKPRCGRGWLLASSWESPDSETFVGEGNVSPRPFQIGTVEPLESIVRPATPSLQQQHRVCPATPQEGEWEAPAWSRKGSGGRTDGCRALTR